LETQQGNISESRAIECFLCQKYKQEFLGENTLERAKVNQWSEFAYCEICICVKEIVYPIFRWKKYCKDSTDRTNSKIIDYLKTLENKFKSNE